LILLITKQHQTAPNINVPTPLEHYGTIPPKKEHCLFINGLAWNIANNPIISEIIELMVRRRADQ